MMEYKETDTNVRLKSELWQNHDKDNACLPFIQAGFENTQEIMDLRVYEMLSILEGDRIEAEDMLFALYFFFNEYEEADDLLCEGLIDQYFDYLEWAYEHPDPSSVLVADIVMPVGMNAEAVYWLFDHIVRKYWESPE